MSVTVDSIAHLPILDDAVRVTGGSGGLQNEVLRVSVMEVPDFYTYSFEPGLFLLSTFSCFQDDPEQMIQALSTLADKKISGILLKLNRFVDQLPPELIQIANEKNIPLLITEQNLKFRDVIYEIISSICSDQTTSAILYEQIFQPPHNEEYARERLKLLGFQPGEAYYTAVILPRCANSRADLRLLQHRFSDVLLPRLPGSILHLIGDGFLILSPLAAKDTAPLQFRDHLTALFSIWEDGAAFVAGCSLAEQELCRLGRSYTDAKQAAEYGRLLKPDCSVHLSSDFFEFELTSHLLDTREEQKLQQRVLDPIWAYDAHYHAELWSSLSACLSMRTLKEASASLCIHISTLRYRLNRIQELTDLDFFLEGDRYILRTAYLLSLVRRSRNHLGDKI